MLTRRSSTILGLVLFVGAGVGLGARGRLLERPALSSLTIVSVPWDIQTRTALTEKTILEISAATTTALHDAGELGEFQRLLEAATSPLADNALAQGAIRILVLAQYSDGTNSRLSFAENCRVMWKDGRPQSLDQNLFRWVVKRLPPRQQRILADYPNCRQAE